MIWATASSRPCFCWLWLQPILKEISLGVLERTDVEAETPILWPPVAKSWLIWKDADAEKDWRQEEKGMTEDEMFGWHHRLNGHGIGWILGVFDGQGGLLCCCSWGRKELDMTEWLNWIDWMNHSQGNFCKNCVIANSSWSLQCYFTYTMNVFSQWASLPCCLYFIHNIYYEP